MGEIRNSSFTRASNPKPLHINPLHVDIIDAVYKYRYLTTSQLATLIPGIQEHSLKRPVRALYDHKYLLRPVLQRDAGPFHRSKVIHSIASRGAELLRQKRDYFVPKNSWDEYERKERIKDFHHDVALSQFLVKLRADISRRENLELYLPWHMVEEGILPGDESNPRSSKHTQWKTSRGNVVPDEVVIIHDRDRPEGMNRKLLLIEMDRGTEAIERFLKEGTSIRLKIEKYLEAYGQGMHASTYGLKNMRVAFITTSRQRIHNMTRLIRQLGVTDRLFLFTTHKEVQDAADLPEMQWLNNRSEPVTLL